MSQERTAAGIPVRNTLLLQIPEDEFRTILPHLELVEFSNTDRLESEGTRIEAVYFLNGGIGSMIIETSDGRMVEVGLAGREDMIGLPLAAGLDEFTFSVVVRGPGMAFGSKATP
jgi:CRP-like cAMP-binding protein